MAAYTSILLLAALCIGTAYSLQCYTCAAATSNSNCNTVSNCTSGLTYCQTTVASASAVGISATSITKLCTATCTPTSINIAVGSTSISCCTTDLCNTNGAISIKSSYSVIFLVLGTVVMLVSGSLL